MRTIAEWSDIFWAKLLPVPDSDVKNVLVGGVSLQEMLSEGDETPYDLTGYALLVKDDMEQFNGNVPELTEAVTIFDRWVEEVKAVI